MKNISDNSSTKKNKRQEELAKALRKNLMRRKGKVNNVGKNAEI